MASAIQDRFATVNGSVFKTGDVVIATFGVNPTGLSGTVVAFLPIFTHGLPGYNIDWVDGTNSDILAMRLRRA